MITLELSDMGFQMSHVSSQSVQQFEFTCSEGLGNHVCYSYYVTGGVGGGVLFDTKV